MGMATDVMSTYNSLQVELEQAKVGLHELDENIKKLIQTSGRYKQDRPNINKQGGQNVFLNTKRFNDNNNFNNNSRKRPNETKIVFSRLSRKVTGDSDVEDELDQQNKTKISSQVTRTLPTKQEVLRAQLNPGAENKKDNAEVCRARRVFGSLLGTLRAFCKEEALARDKDVFARRVSLEKKIECKASIEAAEMANRRRNLVHQREQQLQRIKALDLQMQRVQCHEIWEKAQRQLAGYIKTSAKPPIYWLPAKHNEKTRQSLASTQHQLKKSLEKRRHELNDDLEVINSKRAAVVKTEDIENNINTAEPLLDHQDNEESDVMIKLEKAEVTAVREKMDTEQLELIEITEESQELTEETQEVTEETQEKTEETEENQEITEEDQEQTVSKEINDNEEKP